MFQDVEAKLQRAEVCLTNLRWLDKNHGPLAHVGRDRQQELRCYIECFFYQLVSAMDFFMQGVNTRYALGLSSDRVTHGTVRDELRRQGRDDVINVLCPLWDALRDESAWQYQVKYFRDCATHRMLLRHNLVAVMGREPVRLHLPLHPDKDDKAKTQLETLPYCDKAMSDMRQYLQDLYRRLP